MSAAKNPRSALALGLLLAAGLGTAFAETGRPPLCPGCNVVLIGIDDVRADSFQAMGAAEDVIPSLNRFASSSVAFTQAISAAPWSLPSFMSIFTGVYPFNHHLTNKYSDFNAEPMVPARLSTLSPGTRTLGEVLRDRGWRAGGFTGGAALTGSFGFSAGFEVYDDSATFGGFDRSVPEALRWLSDVRPGEKFFLFVHGYDAHSLRDAHFPAAFAARFRRLREDQMAGRPLRVNAEERALIRSSYAQALRAMDEHLRPLLERLDQPDISSRTVVLIAADHGEELFEHGGIDHGMTLYDEVIRVPLLLRVPGQAPGSVPLQVRTVDVLPTLLDVLGIAPDRRLARQMRGVSLRPMLSGSELHLNALCETDFLLQVSLRSLRTADGWKIVYDRYRPSATRLFRLSSDPAETRDVSAQEPKVANALQARLVEFFGPQ
ncbi:MAG: sulfatase [Elusimicrobia bacterium]|nr:sulfatase [Elusimicrobiota bacterium]